MSDRTNIRYVLVPTFDGVHRAFPMSKHVLDAKRMHVTDLRRNTHKIEGPTSIRHWRPSLVQQASSLVLMIALCASSYGVTYSKLNSTLSYFRDTETSFGNMLGAGSLNFDLNPGEVSMPIEQGQHIILAPLFTPDSHTFPIEYRVHAEMIGEPTPLCSLLQATGTTSPFVYSGLLRDLLTDPATTTGHGHLDVFLPDASVLGDGASCTIALVYQGWHAGALEGTGYTDEERDTFTFVYTAPEPEPAIEESFAPLSLETESVEDTATTTEEMAEQDDQATTTEEVLAPEEEPAPEETEQKNATSTEDVIESPPPPEEEVTDGPEEGVEEETVTEEEPEEEVQPDESPSTEPETPADIPETPTEDES